MNTEVLEEIEVITRGIERLAKLIEAIEKEPDKYQFEGGPHTNFGKYHIILMANNQIKQLLTMLDDIVHYYKNQVHIK